DHKVFAACGCGGRYERKLFFLRRIPPEAIHVVVEDDGAGHMRRAFPYANSFSIGGQRLYCLLEPATHAADCNRHSTISVGWRQVLPRLGVELIGSSEISVEVVGANSTRRRLRDCPVPRTVLLDLPSPGHSEPAVIDH